MKTSEEYVNSLRELDRTIYLFGEKLENPLDHPIVKPSLNAVAQTYDIAHDPDHQELGTATSSITGEPINRFTHLHQSADDLVKKIKMQQSIGPEDSGLLPAVCWLGCDECTG